MPDVVGPYRLLKLIGEGGMGAVYLAERENEFRKRVAVKLIRAEMASPDVVRRFVMERHLLAALNHPNIVRLVDGGATEEGLPYLVVDYVEGIPIDQYCDQHKLPMDARLRLFIDVCVAVHHAHQSLIIHCDLKPGNILVTAEGTPMLLDFGIAKLLDPLALGLDTQTQATRARAYTPRYASPEQLRGEPVTTASDLYALGVILYELLSRRSPYAVNTESLVEWVRAVCEEDPVAPNTGDGDLDAIVLKALRKQARDRYGSVDQMAEDIRRHLAGRPVMARKNTAAYVARKFLARHKFGAIAAAAVVLSIGGGLAATLWEARIAARRFEDVRSLAHAFLFDVHDSIQNLPGSTEARSLIARTGAEYLDRLARDSKGNAGLELELAQGYLKIGDVEGNPFVANLGDTAKAIENYDKALALAERETARHPNDAAARELAAKIHLGLAEVLPFRNRRQEGLTHATKALALYRQLSAANPQSVEYRMGMSRGWETTGDLEGGLQGANLGLTEEAAKAYRESLAAIPNVAPDSQFGERVARARAVVMTKVADITSRSGENLAAISTYQSALAVVQESLRRNPGSTKLREIEATIYNRLAASETGMSEVQKALEYFRQSIASTDASLAVDPNNEKARGAVITTQKNMGDLYLYVVQNGSEALRCYQKAADLLEIECRRDPHNMVWSQHLAEVLSDIGTCLIGIDKPDEAREPIERGMAIAKDLADRPGATMDQVYYYAYLLVSADLDKLRDPARALPYALKAVEMSHGGNPMCLHVLAEAYAATGKLKKAIAADEKALALYPPAPPGGPTPHNRAVVERALAKYRARQHE